MSEDGSERTAGDATGLGDEPQVIARIPRDHWVYGAVRDLTRDA
jgi:hypothetical protein